MIFLPWPIHNQITWEGQYLTIATMSEIIYHMQVRPCVDGACGMHVIYREKYLHIHSVLFCWLSYSVMMVICLYHVISCMGIFTDTCIKIQPRASIFIYISMHVSPDKKPHTILRTFGAKSDIISRNGCLSCNFTTFVLLHHCPVNVTQVIPVYMYMC